MRKKPTSPSAAGRDLLAFSCAVRARVSVLPLLSLLACPCWLSTQGNSLCVSSAPPRPFLQRSDQDWEEQVAFSLGSVRHFARSVLSGVLTRRCDADTIHGSLRRPFRTDSTFQTYHHRRTNTLHRSISRFARPNPILCHRRTSLPILIPLPLPSPFRRNPTSPFVYGN